MIGTPELPPKPDAMGYLCDWGDVNGMPRQTFYYGEPGSASIDDWNEFPKVHENLPLYTAEQMQAYARRAAAAAQGEPS